MKYFLASSFKDGSIPYWCPNYFCGSPFVSDIQSGVFYPISAVFALLPFPFSLNVYILLHFFLGFCFCYHFLRELGLSKSSSLIPTISFCYAGYVIASINVLNSLSTIIWLPAILLSVHRAFSKGHRSWYFLSVLFLAMAILGGEPQLFLMMLGLTIAYVLAFVRKSKSGLASRSKGILILFLLILFSLLLTAIQLGPTYRDYLLSIRYGGISYAEATRYSLSVEMLKHFILPLHFSPGFASDPASLSGFFSGQGEVPWLLTIYPGLIVTCLALLSLIRKPSLKVHFWVLVFLSSLLLALGVKTPIYKLFYGIFPFFRFPAKFMALTGFSIVVMAAYGLERLRLHIGGGNIKFYYIVIFLGPFLVADLFLAHRGLNPMINSSFYRHHHPSLKAITVDPEHFRVYVHPEGMPQASAEQSILSHHIEWQNLSMPNLGIINRLFHVNGVSGFELIYQHLITKLLSKPWNERIRFLKLTNVKYIISSQALDKHPDVASHVDRVNSLVFRIREYMPRAWMVGQLLPIKKGTIEELVNDSFNPRRSALTNSEIATSYKRPFFREVNDIRYESDRRIRIEATAESSAILILSESSYPGWQVFVDGEKKECLWLNLLFQGVEIDQGKHIIEFVYQPAGFPIYFSISLVTFVLFVGSWCFYWLTSRKKPIT